MSNGDDAGLYDLSNGEAIASLAKHASPLDEYRAAFADRDQEFLTYFSFPERRIERRVFNRGQFWDLALSAAAFLHEQGLRKGDRIIQCFSANSLHDLLFRLGGVMAGCTPVTINWEADDNERILYKAQLTDAKMLLYDEGMAGRVAEMRPGLPGVILYQAKEIENFKTSRHFDCVASTYDDEKMIVFTSGTTGRPKAVSLPHRSYLANRLTFESYFGVSGDQPIDFLLVNPMHHTNSTALTDWALRHPNARVSLLQRYTTGYWNVLVDAVSQKRDMLITSLVARHIDFLDSLANDSKLPVEREKIRKALNQTHVLIGSAPVGPITVNRILKFGDNLPHVRFGSTETCLQVMGTPIRMSQADSLAAFQAGWTHRFKGGDTTGYYIGRPHPPFTRVKIVKSTSPESEDYFRECPVGEPGYLVTQGANIMSGYVKDPAATKNVFKEGWYTGLRDIGFALKNKADGGLDYYWMSRDSELLVRGGSKYAYEQISEELSRVLVKDFGLNSDDFRVAVVGLRIDSEHEDTCCVTIELNGQAESAKEKIEREFIETAGKKVSKGARPHHIQFAKVPVNFKGAILYSQMQQEFLNKLKPKK